MIALSECDGMDISGADIAILSSPLCLTDKSSSIKAVSIEAFAINVDGVLASSRYSVQYV